MQWKIEAPIRFNALQCFLCGAGDHAKRECRWLKGMPKVKVHVEPRCLRDSPAKKEREQKEIKERQRKL